MNRYEELLRRHYYVEHILRRPPEQWPDPVSRTFAKLNKKMLYDDQKVYMRGVLEFVSDVNAGRL